MLNESFKNKLLKVALTEQIKRNYNGFEQKIILRLLENYSLNEGGIDDIIAKTLAKSAKVSSDLTDVLGKYDIKMPKDSDPFKLDTSAWPDKAKADYDSWLKSTQTIPSQTGVGRADTEVGAMPAAKPPKEPAGGDSMVRRKEAIPLDQAKTELDAGARPQDVSNRLRNTVRITKDPTKVDANFRDAEAASMKKLDDMKAADAKAQADARAATDARTISRADAEAKAKSDVKTDGGKKPSTLDRWGGPLVGLGAAALLSRDSQDQQQTKAETTPTAEITSAAAQAKTFGDAFKLARAKADELAKAGKIKNASLGQFEWGPEGKEKKLFQTNIAGEKYVAPKKQTKVNESLTEEESADLLKKMQDELTKWTQTYGTNTRPKTGDGAYELNAFDKLWSATKFNPNPSQNSSFTYKPVNATRAELNRDGQNDSLQRTLDLKTADVGLKNANFRLGGNYDKAKIQDIQSAIGVKDGSGVFDQNTDKAVRDFQTKYGLKVDGIVGDQTMSMIDKIKQFNTDMTPASTTATQPVATPNPAKKEPKGPEIMNASYQPQGSIIEAVSKVLRSNHSNIFQEAAKAKKEKMADKDYDQDGEVESAKDEVWGSRMRAAKAAGKLKEEQIEDKSVVGSGTITTIDPKTGKKKDYISPVTLNNPHMQASPDKKIPIPKPRPKDLGEEQISEGGVDDLIAGVMKKGKTPKNPSIPYQAGKITRDVATHPNTLKVGGGAVAGAVATNTDDISDKAQAASDTVSSSIQSVKDAGKYVSDKTSSAIDTVSDAYKKAKKYVMGEEIFSAEELAYFEAVAPTPEDHAPNPTQKNNATGGKGRGSLAEARPTEEMHLGANQLHMNAKRAADNMSNIVHTFKNKEKVKMTKGMGVSFLNRHSSAKTADEKDAILNYANQSPEAFAHVTKGGAIPSAEKEPKIKLGSMKGK